MLSKPESRENIEESIVQIKDIKNREKDPPSIEAHDGWSPYEAQKFLKDHGISTGDYHEQFGEWFCSSPYLEIENGYNIPNNIAYYIDGNETTAKKLKLVLNVNDPDNQTESENQFYEIAEVLFEKALNQSVSEDCKKLMESGEGEFRPNNYLRITLSKEEWEGGIKGGYTRKFVIEIL